ncbi:Insulin-like growth factor-binding protein complex acid labile subunit [Holothuria leucospilota]|uniref:Insulin-like growth factor-binding protein complex acid labile subunit n=1 Tax=Holothuria leucospilota TaxID=206669 RepID=A0A9Q1CNH7_HOLLE|nr:Insulin-like growth factor-binding protein complex acid labile subunit [Holothuria leucospilota]
MRFLLFVAFAVMVPQILLSDQKVCGQKAVCKCDPSFTKMDCAHRNLSSVPTPLPQSVKKLNLSYNSLRRIPKMAFSSCPLLTNLNLDFNQISEIEEGAFLGNGNMTSLSMKYNNLRRIPNNTFTSCHQLQVIYLDNNEISEIEEGAFAPNCSITNMQMSNNQLQKIPIGAISRCKLLQLLYLNKNEINELEDGTFVSNPYLRYFTLQSNRLRSIPPFFYRSIQKASGVFLSTNKITEVLTSSFRDLEKVQCFALNGNQIRRLPRDLFRDILLSDTLDLSDNLIDEIPENLFIRNRTFHYMTMLFLHKNRLRFLRPNTFEGLYNLKYVFLNSNQLQSLANGAFSGSSSKFIYLFGNNFTTIQNNSFANENITEVHLFKNPIETFSTNALDGLEINTTLYVSCKLLSELPRYNREVNIKCVRSKFVPTVIADKKFIKILRREGFNCTRHGPGKKASFTCQPCRPGTFGDGETGCSPCPSGGYYQDDIGQTASIPGEIACKPCNDGTFVEKGYGASIGDCQVCPEGTNQNQPAGYRGCPCKNRYTRTNRFDKCHYCFEEGLNCSLDYEFLLPGYFWNWSFPGANITEYKLFVSNLRNETRFYDPLTTTYEKYLPRVHRCPRPDSCVNNEGHMVDKLEGSCERGYKGWLCSKCQSGYYAILDNCMLCPNKFWLYSEIIIVMCICLALYFFVRWQNKHDSNLSGNQRTLIDKISSRMKILLGFYQVVGELFESLHGLNWKYPFRLLGEFTSYVKLNVLRLFFRPQCFNEKLEIGPILRFKIRLCLPFGFVIICFLLYQIQKAYVIYRFRGCMNIREKKLRSFKATLYTYTLLFLFITYPPICDAIFSLYPGACQKFYFDRNNSHSIRLLRSDFDINCNNLAVYHNLAFVATALYVVAFPCVLLFLLRKYHRKKLDVKKPVRNTMSVSSNDHATGSEERPLLGEDYAEHGAVPVWLKFLCENYKRQFWFWEIIELVRKIAQTTMVTLLGWEDNLTILLTIGAAVLFLCLHARYLPMKNTFEQRLQVLFSLTAIFINVMAKAVPTSHETVVQTCVIILNVTIGLVVLAEAVVGLISYIRRRKTLCIEK